MKNSSENNKKEEKEEEKKALEKIEKPPKPEEIKKIKQVLADAKFPPETIERFTAFFASERVEPIPHPLLTKITSEHISKMITCSDDEDKRKHESTKRSQTLSLVTFFAVVGFVVFVIIFLVGNENLLKSILFGLGTFLAGTGAGYGFAKRK